MAGEVCRVTDAERERLAGPDAFLRCRFDLFPFHFLSPSFWRRYSTGVKGVKEFKNGWKMILR